MLPPESSDVRMPALVRVWDVVRREIVGVRELPLSITYESSFGLCLLADLEVARMADRSGVEWECVREDWRLLNRGFLGELPSLLLMSLLGVLVLGLWSGLPKFKFSSKTGVLTTTICLRAEVIAEFLMRIITDESEGPGFRGLPAGEELLATVWMLFSFIAGGMAAFTDEVDSELLAAGGCLFLRTACVGGVLEEVGTSSAWPSAIVPRTERGSSLADGSRRLRLFSKASRSASVKSPRRRASMASGSI